MSPPIRYLPKFVPDADAAFTALRDDHAEEEAHRDQANRAGRSALTC